MLTIVKIATGARLPSDDGQGRRQSSARRYLSGLCGSALWLWDPSWPELVHPHASAIDTPLPVPPENAHGMVGSRAPGVRVEGGGDDPRFNEYPEVSLAEWHRRKGLSA